jgi:hypothetical protein
LLFDVRFGVRDARSQDGVKRLAASPETMLAPGTPTSVAEDIAKNIDDPAAMAKAILKDTMSTKYGLGGETYRPAAAMDVLDSEFDQDRDDARCRQGARWRPDRRGPHQRFSASRGARRREVGRRDGPLKAPDRCFVTSKVFRCK